MMQLDEVLYSRVAIQKGRYGTSRWSLYLSCWIYFYALWTIKNEKYGLN